MAESDLVHVLQSGASQWNAWRRRERPRRVDLTKSGFSGLDLRRANLRGADLGGAILDGADLREADLRRAFLGGSSLEGANLEGANLKHASLIQTSCMKASFRAAHLRRANLMKAHAQEADLTRADLTGANLHQTDFSTARLDGADLTSSQMVETVFRGARLDGCRVYGIAAWNLVTTDAIQKDLIVTKESDPNITVDSIEVAQFIYLLLNNRQLKNVIDTVTARMVVILGRFTASRKSILEAIRVEVRKQGLLPVIFDFEKPASRDLTETVSTLSHLSRCVIADLTDPRSVPHELATVIPQLPSVPVQPIIEASHEPYALFEHLQRYPSVLDVMPYESPAGLAAALGPQLSALAGGGGLR